MPMPIMRRICLPFGQFWRHGTRLMSPPLTEPYAVQADTVAGALDRAVRIRKEGEKVLVTGSFYMAEEALQWLNRTSR